MTCFEGEMIFVMSILVFMFSSHLSFLSSWIHRLHIQEKIGCICIVMKEYACVVMFICSIKCQNIQKEQSISN